MIMNSYRQNYLEYSLGTMTKSLSTSNLIRQFFCRCDSNKKFFCLRFIFSVHNRSTETLAAAQILISRFTDARTFHGYTLLYNFDATNIIIYDVKWRLKDDFAPTELYYNRGPSGPLYGIPYLSIYLLVPWDHGLTYRSGHFLIF